MWGVGWGGKRGPTVEDGGRETGEGWGSGQSYAGSCEGDQQQVDTSSVYTLNMKRTWMPDEKEREREGERACTFIMWI